MILDKINKYFGVLIKIDFEAFSKFLSE